MACGTPVIGSDVGGIKYTVKDGETGFLVPPHDPQALAAAIRQGIACPEKYEMLCSNAIRRVNQCFTWEFVAREADRLYAKVTAKKYLRPAYLLKLRRTNTRRLKYSQSNAIVYATH